MKVLLAISLLFVAFFAAEGQLICPRCSDEICPNENVTCPIGSYSCYAAQVSALGGTIKYKKGCKGSDLCGYPYDLCPRPSFGKCLKTGCCNTTGCDAPLTALPVAPTSTQDAVVVPTAQLHTQETITIQRVMPTSTRATSSSKPVPAKSPMPVPGKSSMHVMASLTASEVEKSPSSPGLKQSEVLVKHTTPKPTCDGAGIRYPLNLMATMLIALGLTALVF